MAQHLHFAPKSGNTPTRCHPRSPKKPQWCGNVVLYLADSADGRRPKSARIQIICRVPLPADSKYSLTSHSARTGGHSRGIKWREREANHSSLWGAVIKNTWGCTSIHCTFKIQCLTTQNDTPALPLWLTLRRLMSYTYGAPILDVSRSHTTTQHSR